MKTLITLSALALTLAACGADPKDPPKTEANVPPSGSTAAISSAGAPASGAKVYPQTTKGIDAKVGESFNVVLPGNVTTPFEWRYDEPADKGATVAMTAHDYTDAPPANCQGCDGYKGTFNFTFTAKAEGTTKLHFTYGRVTKSDAPAVPREFAVEVHVTK